MRVVLDTNVLARALPGRNNAAEAALLLVVQPPHALVLSEFILTELARMLRYDRVRRILGLIEEQIDAYAIDYAQQPNWCLFRLLPRMLSYSPIRMTTQSSPPRSSGEPKCWPPGIATFFSPMFKPISDNSASV